MDALLIVLGWLLGLLSPAILDLVRKKRESADIRAAILFELKQIKPLLALSSHYIKIRQGKIKRLHLETLIKTLEPHIEIEEMARITSSLKQQLTELNDTQLAKLYEALQGDPARAPIPKRHPSPFLDAHITQLFGFDKRTHKHLLDIKTHLSFLNEEIERANYYFNLTFSPLLDEGLSEIIKKNLDETLLNYSTRSDFIVNKIANLEAVIEKI